MQFQKHALTNRERFEYAISESRFSKLNILMVYEDVPNGHRGGVQIHVITLYNSLRRRGHNVLLLPLQAVHVDRSPSLEQVMTLLTELFSLLFKMAKTIGTMRKEKINLIHVHGARLPLLLGRAVSVITRCPLMVTIHEAWSKATQLNRLYKGADKTIVVSQEVRATLGNCGVDTARLAHIPNMVDDKWFDSVSRSGDVDREDPTHRILFLGRLETGKIDLLRILLEAMPRILEEFPTAQIWIGGQSGSRLPEVEKLVNEVTRKFGKEAVLQLGYLKNPADVVRKVDVVVGVGRIAIEAMAQGRATIVGSSRNQSKVTGGLISEENAMELMKCNFTGRNFKQTIDAQRMAELVFSVIRDSRFRKNVGDFCRDFAEKNFRAKNIAAKTESLYVDCLRQKGR